jgi:hypothetical protein
VDRGNLGRQTLKEFQAFITPEENRPFAGLYNVQQMKSNKLDDVSRVCIPPSSGCWSFYPSPSRVATSAQATASNDAGP